MSELIFSLIFIQVSVFVFALCLVLSAAFMGLRMRTAETVRSVAYRPYRTRRLEANR